MTRTWEKIVTSVTDVFTEAAEDLDSSEHHGMQMGILTTFRILGIESRVFAVVYDALVEWFNQYGWST